MRAARTGARRLRFSPAARRPIRRRGWPRSARVVDFVARVGAADVESETSRFRAIGVTPHLVGDPNPETGRLIALIDADGERSFLTDRGANEALEARDIPDALIATASHISLSGYSFFAPSPRAAVLDVMRRAGDKPISIDPASAEFLREVGADTFLAWTRGATILFPNEEEAAILAGSTNPETQCVRLATRYPLVVIKRGAAGAEAAEGARRWRIDASKSEPVDIAGVGDPVVAALLAESERRFPVTSEARSGRHHRRRRRVRRRLPRRPDRGRRNRRGTDTGCRGGAEAAVKVGGRPRPHARLPSTGRVGLSAVCVPPHRFRPRATPRWPLGYTGAFLIICRGSIKREGFLECDPFLLTR